MRLPTAALDLISIDIGKWIKIVVDTGNPYLDVAAAIVLVIIALTGVTMLITRRASVAAKNKKAQNSN